MLSTIIVLLLLLNLLIFIGYYWYKIKSTKKLSDQPVSLPNIHNTKFENAENLQVKEIENFSLEKNKLQESMDQLINEKEKFEVEKKMYVEKNKKSWSMNEAVYKEKKKVDELNETLQIEKEKLETEKKKVEEKVKKLWGQSMAIHKEKERINELKVEIEKKHTEIIDSVNYAKRIQEAILPNVREIKFHLPNSFIYFKPRDIVSGDFYWFSHKDEKNIIAAIDCTGHGVPGAFMSMIGNTLLNEIVNERGLTDPAQILNNLNHEVNSSLKQTQQDSESRDGMDGAICCLEFPSLSSEVQEVKIHYAGANRPLYLIKNGILEETKANKFSIGGLQYDAFKSYNTHTFTLQTNDTAYIFTDGFPDQFGSTGKKLMTKKFKEILLSIQDKSMEQQKEYLESYIEQWKGDTEQTDDLLVIGIRI